MTSIRCVYPDRAPVFPATDQHPDAARYTVRSEFLGRDVVVDAVGGEPTTQEADAVLNPPADPRVRLEAIDRASIRALREWVAKQPDAPRILKDREAEAVAEREKLK